tara:strand:+ start:1248 stop:1928 length:681 start_codon:yes stop_codon:yes gene_type:complete
MFRQGSSKSTRHRIFAYFLVISILNQISYAKVLKISQFFNKNEEKCISKVLYNPWRNYFYPGLFDDLTFSDNEKELMDETVSFCECRSEADVQIQQLKENNPIAYSFRDKARDFEIDDRCAVNSFSKKPLEYFYMLNVGTILKSMTKVRIESSLVQGIENFRNKREIASEVNCVESKIIKQCTKVKSLKISYDCIVENTSDPMILDDHYKECRFRDRVDFKNGDVI